MALLGRWYLLGEQEEGIECNAIEGYQWCEKAANGGDADGMAYQGICLIHGYGVVTDYNDGFTLLIDAATEGSGKCHASLFSNTFDVC
jgi:TPR repeat protein